MWAFVDPGRESRVSRAITSLCCTFLVLASLTAMSVRFPLGSFIHRGLSPSSFITFLSLSLSWRQSGRAWRFVDGGTVDIAVLPEISDRVLEALRWNVLW